MYKIFGFLVDELEDNQVLKQKSVTVYGSK